MYNLDNVSPRKSMFLQSIAKNYGLGIKYTEENEPFSLKKGFQILPISNTTIIKQLYDNFDFATPILNFDIGNQPSKSAALDLYLVQQVACEQLPDKAMITFSPLGSIADDPSAITFSTPSIKEIFFFCKVSNFFIIDYILIIDSLNHPFYTNTVEVINV